MSENVLIIGASADSSRYSYMAMTLLEENGHKTFLVNPKKPNIEGRQVLSSISEVGEKIDTVTMYVNPSISDGLEEQLKNLAPKRVIFNPGTENDRLEEALSASGIFCERACTLILLRTQQY